MKCLRLSLFIILLCLTGSVTSSTTPVQTNKLTMQVSSSDFKCMQCCLNWETKALIILVCVFGVGLSIKLIDPFSKQRSPDLPLPVYLLQLIQGQPRHVISPAWPKSGPITQETPIFVRCPNPLNRFLSSLGGEVAVLLWAPRMTYVHISERETSQMMMVHIHDVGLKKDTCICFLYCDDMNNISCFVWDNLTGVCGKHGNITKICRSAVPCLPWERYNCFNQVCWVSF